MSAYLNALSEASKEVIFNELVRQKERADALEASLMKTNALMHQTTELMINPPIVLDNDARAARLAAIKETHDQYQHLIFNFYRRKQNELS